MSELKIGINGFGRIGRLVTRIALRRGLDVNAINDPFIDPDYMVYMFKYDSVHGRWPGIVQRKENRLIIDGKIIETSKEKDPSKLTWSNMNVDIVIDATGVNTTFEKASMHIISGAKKVIITAPSPDAPMFVIGVNHLAYDPSMNVISNASCTTNCAAPVLKILEETFGIEEGSLTTIHSYTASQKIVDGPSAKDWRGGRGACLNIIPSSTGAAKAIAKVLPSVSGKINGMAFRVPCADVSAIDLNVKVSREVTFEELKDCFKKASQSPELKGIIGYTEDDVVSSDFITTTLSCVFDAKASMLINKTFLKVVAWYDNEYAYSYRVVDLALMLHEKAN